jgi:hypothetical protein
MQPVHTMVAVLFAAVILVTGCTAYNANDQRSPAAPAPNLLRPPRLPIYRSGPAGRADQQRLEGSRSRRLGASLVAASCGVPLASLLEHVWLAQSSPRGSGAARQHGPASHD